MSIAADRRNQPGKVGAGVPSGSAIAKKPAQCCSQTIRVSAFAEKLFDKALHRCGLDGLEPFPLPTSPHRLEQGADVNAGPFDRRLRKLAFHSEITRVGIQEPVEGLDDSIWLRRCPDFDLDQVIEEVPDRTTCRVNG